PAASPVPPTASSATRGRLRCTTGARRCPCRRRSAGGHAWLMTLSEERATQLVAQQGFGSPKEYGPKAPTTFRALMKILDEDRRRGYSLMAEQYAPGMSALAAPVVRRGGDTVGVITIAGPLQRLTPARMQALGPALVAAASDLALASSSSPLFNQRARMATGPR
ncbi:MAG: hypothetical protein EOO24_62715, partial [Comamonadaceae bacterium]